MVERKFLKMKKDIYLDYCLVVFLDIIIGYKFFSGLIKLIKEIVEFEGEIYLFICVEILLDLYLFYIGC